MRLFIDLDNTLAKFSNKENEKQVVEIERFKAGYFANLEPYIDRVEFLESLPSRIKRDIYILSTITETAHCIQEKRDWCNQWLPWIREDQLIFINPESTKALFCHGVSDLLIDDYGKNINTWQAVGGEAFKIEDNTTIGELIEWIDSFDLLRPHEYNILMETFVY